MHRIAPVLLLVLMLQQATPAVAETERIATTCEKSVCFYWWPKVVPPPGWQQDRDQSIRFNFNAMAPGDKSFVNAETVMYANAVYRPRVPEAKTLEDFVVTDHAKFRSETPGLSIVSASALKTSDGKIAKTWALIPKAQGQWERVAYFEEGEYYMVFVISSRSEAGLQREMPSFERFIESYKE